MSATVTYKGATLTTATNQTRTLDTAGTYLEDDITITDVTTIPTGTKNISITANGTTTEDVTSYATASITASVPNSYTASDEGKVVSNGSLVSQSSATYTANGTYDTTLVDDVTVDVQGSTVSVVDTTDSGGGTVRTITASGATIPTPASDISKLILNGVTQMDVTDTTATVSDVASGKVFTQVDGTTGTGTASGGYDVEDIATRNYTGDIALIGNTIREYAFAQAGISSINAPNVTSLGKYAFYQSPVSSAIFSSLSGPLREGAFREAEIVEITPTSFPLITRLEPYAFAYNTALTSAVIPNLGNNDTTNNGNSLFNGCSNLEVADLGNIVNIPNNTFTNCTKLGVVVLRRNQVLTMGNINAFQSTPYRTTGNTKAIYVPQSLISSYQTASNWSQLYAANNDVFQPIEGSYYATHYADGTLIPT